MIAGFLRYGLKQNTRYNATLDSKAWRVRPFLAPSLFYCLENVANQHALALQNEPCVLLLLSIERAKDTWRTADIVFVVHFARYKCSQSYAQTKLLLNKNANDTLRRCSSGVVV